MESDLEPKVGGEIEKKEKLSLRILLADDEYTNRRMFKSLLESMNHKVKLVENGQFLVDELKGSESYDLVFSDNTMPVKKGVEALEEVRSIEKYKNIPFIIATTDSSVDGSLKERIIKSGAFFLPKPFSIDQLSDAIEQVTKDKV